RGVDPRAAHDLEVGLVNQRRRLERSRLVLSPQLLSRDHAEILVDERQDPLERAAVARARLAQQARHLARPSRPLPRRAPPRARVRREPRGVELVFATRDVRTFSIATAADGWAASRGWSMRCFSRLACAARSSGSATSYRPWASSALPYDSLASAVR